jgi:hypothetical protein
MPPTTHETGAGPQRWLIVRGLLVLLLSVATALASLVLLGIGGIFLVPLVLVAGVIHSRLRSPVAWVCYGFLLVGLSAGAALSEDHGRGLLPAMPLLWVGVGLAGFAMIFNGYARIFLLGEAIRMDRSRRGGVPVP